MSCAEPVARWRDQGTGRHQTLDDEVLSLTRRGHDVQSTRDAFRLLRLAGFKIHGPLDG